MAVASQPQSIAPVVAAGQVYVGEIASTGPSTVEVFDAAGVQGCAGTPKVCQPQARLVHDASTTAVAATQSLVFVATARTSTVEQPRLHTFALAGPTSCEGAVPRTCRPRWSIDLPADVGFAGPISIANGIVVVAERRGWLRRLRAPPVSRG